MRLAGSYGIIVGILMLAQWAFALINGQVPEVQTEPYRISFHLAAECMTAIGLIVGGVGLFKNCSWAVMTYLVAAGMLCYSVVVSPGYFAQQGQWAMVIMFATLLILTLGSIVRVARSVQP